MIARRWVPRPGGERPLPSATDLATLLLAVPLLAVAPGHATAQETPSVGREAAEALDFAELEFDPPRPEHHTVGPGVRVLFVADPTLPLVDVVARFRGGFSYFPREYHAAGTALPSLLRNGGTEALPPDSLDALMEFYAVTTTFGGGGESLFSSMNVLAQHLERGLALWGDLLRRPRFDSARVEVWRGRELERVARRADDPARLAFSEFNHLMYGDHPVGWEMRPTDLEPEDLSPERLRWMQRRVLCPGNLVLGVTGDVTWDRIEPLLEAMLDGWEPCPVELAEPPLPHLEAKPGVYLIPRELAQSTVVMAHPTDVRQGDDPTFFASRVANSILGAGGFSSRILSKVRTEEGYAYSASSFWTTPRRSRGLVGAVTRSKAETTVAAARAILDVMEELRREPPGEEEVTIVADEMTHGFVFNFESPSQVVSRRMFFEAQGLPGDWMERYLDGIQAVTPTSVHRVFRRHLRPDEMTILIVGDPDAFDAAPETLGEVTVLQGG